MEDPMVNLAPYAIGFFGFVILVALVAFAGFTLKDIFSKPNGG